MKKCLSVFLFIALATSFSIAQNYVVISVDTSVHFNITMKPGETYYYSTLSGCTQSPASTSLGFIDVDEEVIDFIDVDIDDVFLVGIITPGPTFIYQIEFNMSLKNNAPPPGVIDDVSMVSVFLNNSGAVVGGYIRSNMSLTLESISSTIDESNSLPIVTIYPNPTTDVLHIEHRDDQMPGLIEIFDSKGNKVAGELSSSSPHIFYLHDLPSGIYWLRVQMEKRLFWQKISKID